MIKTNDKITVMDHDVLCGRGRGLESFPGNKMFRRIIKEHASLYGDATTPRKEKSRIVTLIAEHMVAANMRFLKRQNRKWSVLSHSDARLKVCNQ